MYYITSNHNQITEHDRVHVLFFFKNTLYRNVQDEFDGIKYRLSNNRKNHVILYKRPLDIHNVQKICLNMLKIMTKSIYFTKHAFIIVCEYEISFNQQEKSRP